MRTDAASSLPEDPALLKALAAEQQATITDLTRKLAQVEHYLAQLLRSKYGPRSERCDPAQLALFQAAEESATADAAEPVPQTPVRQHVRLRSFLLAGEVCALGGSGDGGCTCVASIVSVGMACAAGEARRGSGHLARVQSA